VDKLPNICSKFHCLIEKITKPTYASNTTTKYADLVYLNYWLNYELHNIYARVKGPKNFLRSMRTVDIENKLLRELSDCMYNINDDDIENMNVLYRLYNNYNEMNKIIKTYIPNEESFMKYANNWTDKYKEVEKKCLTPSKPFCKALYAFKKNMMKLI
ncbi:hypothetical protein PCYB_005820, partial [Plasmodium cynomolgi strain B]